MKRATWLILFFFLFAWGLQAQQQFKHLPRNLKEEISRRDFRKAKKAYEEAVADSFPITIPPIERIIFDEMPVRDSRLPGATAVNSWGLDIMMPRNIRDRVIKECGNYNAVICTIDSGVDADHQEYAGSWWLSPSNYSGSEGQHWHGTHVAGIIWQMVGEVVKTRGNIKLKDVQFLNSSGSGSFTSARNMATTETNIFKIPVENGLGVIMNNSWGYVGNPISSFDKIVEESLDIGLIWIGSAGNSGKEGPGYPGSSPYFTSVASLDKNLRRSSFSTMNGQVDVAAPGSAINSTMPDNKQGSASGTSMSAPFISGLAGLAYGKYGPILQGRNMYIYLKYICDDIPPDGRDIQTGFGIPYVINMLETDPCLVPGISCDDNPGEDPPADDPTDNPPGEEPPSENPSDRNTIEFTSTDGYFMRYRRENEKEFTFLYIPSLTVSRTGTELSDQLYDETQDLVQNYFKNRAIVIRNQDDYMDAIYWVGQFLEYVTRNEGKPVQVLEVIGRDEYGRKGKVNVFDRATETYYQLEFNNDKLVLAEKIYSDFPLGIRLETLER